VAKLIADISMSLDGFAAMGVTDSPSGTAHLS